MLDPTLQKKWWWWCEGSALLSSLWHSTTMDVVAFPALHTESLFLVGADVSLFHLLRAGLIFFLWNFHLLLSSLTSRGFVIVPIIFVLCYVNWALKLLSHFKLPLLYTRKLSENHLDKRHTKKFQIKVQQNIELESVEKNESDYW